MRFTHCWEGIKIEDLSWLWNYLFEGDLLGFFTTIFTRLIGTTGFYGLIFLTIGVTLYIKMKSIIPIAIIFVGLGTLMIGFLGPEIQQFAMVILGLAFAALFFKLWRSAKR